MFIVRPDAIDEDVDKLIAGLYRDRDQWRRHGEVGGEDGPAQARLYGPQV